MDVKEMRELCRKNGIPDECITSHPGFLIIAFNGKVLRMNRPTFDRPDKKRHISKLPAHKRNRCIA